MSDRTYYLVLPNSPVLSVIAAANERHKAFRLACEAFAGEFGAKRWYTTQSWDMRFLGLAFEGEPAEGWRQNKRKVYSIPDSRTKLGKEIKKRMDALPRGVAAATFSNRLSEALPAKHGYTHWGDGSVSWASFERIGDQYLLSVPTGCKADPPGCRELKTSEYWQLIESAKEQVPA
jgi:hypothetical protein